MIIGNFSSTLTNNAIVASLNSTSLIVFDNNELKVFVGFVKYGESIEYVNEVNLQLSIEIPSRVKITELVVSKNGKFIVLVSTKSAYIVRMNQELMMTKPGRLTSEYSCECFPLHEGFLLQMSSLSILQARILPHKVNNSTIAAVLYNDNCIRFYDINQTRDGLLLVLDFRPYVNQSSENVSLANNTFGLHKNIVSFDFKQTTDSTSFSVLAIDSETDFYSSTIFQSCFTEAVSPRINKIESLDSLPCNPLTLQFIDTPGQEIASIFVLLSAGCIITHLVAITNEIGSFDLFVNDQLQLPSSIGDPKILPTQIQFYCRNRYEIATSNSLFSVNISPWIDNLISNSPTSSTGDGQTIVFELLNIADREVSNLKGNTLKAISIVLSNNEDMNNDLDDFEVGEGIEILHLIVLEQTHLAAVSTLANSSALPLGENKNKKPSSGLHQSMTGVSDETVASLMSQSKMLPAFVISENLSEEEAIDAAMKYLNYIAEKLKLNKQMTVLAVETCITMQHNAQTLGEEQESVDQKLIEETKAVEDLKLKMHELKERMEVARKSINVLISRVDDNAPLSEMEFRMFDRLKHHQNMLSQMSIQIPKLALDLNEQRRLAHVLQMRKVSSQPNKFANVQKNSFDIESLELKIEKLKNQVEKITV